MPSNEATKCGNCLNKVAGTKAAVIGQGLNVPDHKVKRCSFDGCTFNATGKCDFMIACCVKGC